MRGGRFETFIHLYEQTKDEEFFVADVNSLYSHCAKSALFPVGPFEIISDLQILTKVCFDSEERCHKLDGKKMIGIAQVRIVAPMALKEPFLGQDRKGKFIYALCRKCMQNKSKKACKHSEMDRSMILVLCWQEINYAVELGYKVMHIYEAYNYSQEEDLFSEFIQLLAREKIRFSEPNSSLTMQEFTKQINMEMNFSPSLQLLPEEIQPDHNQRQFVKDNLNIVLGKLSEQSNRTNSILVRSQSQLCQAFNQNKNNIENVFAFETACYLQIRAGKKSSRMNLKASSIIYAMILAHSRIFMDKKMRTLWTLNARIFSIANDCLYFTMPLGAEFPFKCSPSLGYFKDELRGRTVLLFASLGPKSSCLTTVTKSGYIDHLIKARGFSLDTEIARNIFSQFSFQKAINNIFVGIKNEISIPQLRMKHSLPMLTSKEVMYFCTFSSDIDFVRIPATNYVTQPFGYV